MTRYEDYIRHKQVEYGSKFDSSELAPKFIRYFNSGERIKVGIYGDVLTGTVGVTTGWKPVFLLMRTSRSLGSGDMLREDNQIIAVQSGRRYIEWPHL